MNYDYYRVFYIVGKTKNITRAARELYTSQPAVTRTIKKLENDLGCQLFYRTKNGMEFTEEGTLSYEDIPDETEESGFDIPTDLLEKVISEVPF